MKNIYGTPTGPADGPDPEGLPDPNAYNPPPRTRKKRMLRWGIGITLASFLAGGGIALAASGGPGASGAAGLSASSGPSQGAMLNSELNTASSVSATVPLPRIRRALARLRALGGVDGEFTFRNSTGFHALAFERGTIQSVSGSDVVVHASDGTTWTWLIVSDTVVRQNGAKSTTSALATGQTVFVAGPVVSGAKDARLFVIRAGGSGSSGSGSSSSSSVSGPAGTSVS